MWNHLSCHTLSSVLGIVVLCPSNCHFPFICRNVRYSWWNSKKSEIFQFFSKISIFFRIWEFFRKFRIPQKRPFFWKVTKKQNFWIFWIFLKFSKFSIFPQFFSKTSIFFSFFNFSFFIFVFIFCLLLIFGQFSIVFEFSMTFCLTLWRKNSLL